VHFRPLLRPHRMDPNSRRRIERAQKDNTAIRHHNDNYGGQIPIWVLSEVLDFSDISKLYEGLFTTAQYRIAENSGIQIEMSNLANNQRRKANKHHPLVRGFEHLTIIRYTCAHHARLWNRSFTPVSTSALRTMREFQTLPAM